MGRKRSMHPAMNKWKVIWVWIVTLSLSGCTTIGAMRNAPLSEGISRTFTADYNRVLKAVRVSLVEDGLKIEDSYKVDDEKWVVLGEQAAFGDSPWGGYGAYTRVIIEKTSDTETTVRVYTKNRLATDIVTKEAQERTKRILSNIESNLNLDLKLQ